MTISTKISRFECKTATPEEMHEGIARFRREAAAAGQSFPEAGPAPEPGAKAACKCGWLWPTKVVVHVPKVIDETWLNSLTVASGIAHLTCPQCGDAHVPWGLKQVDYVEPRSPANDPDYNESCPVCLHPWKEGFCGNCASHDSRGS